MWTFHSTTRTVGCCLAGLASSLTMAGPSQAQQELTINQNQNGLNLPGVTLPHGYDEVRAADGTLCRSSMSGSGAYFDTGVIGGGIGEPGNQVAAYGRLVVPLGQKPTRLDCDHLYQLELQRLGLEVELLKQGLHPSAFSADNAELDDDAIWLRK